MSTSPASRPGTSDPAGDPAGERVTDVLGDPWTAETLDLGHDDEGPVVATLVHRRAPQPTRRAVLYVHGFSDYFFQVDFAAWWLERGYDFYALDLRKYGRSLRDGQTPAFVTDVAEYGAELGQAWARITERDGHEHVIGAAHSTGGLVLPLWLDQARPAELAGLVLNSPWLDMQGSVWLRTVGTVAIDQLGARRPRFEIKRAVDGFYTEALHRDHHGEWDFDLDWKPAESMKVYAGWLRAIRRGHARVHRGLDVGAPVLVLSSDRSSHPTSFDDDLVSTDVVLDVRQIRRWASSLSTQVTYTAVPGAIHDVVLSRRPVRERAYAEIDRWHEAYVLADAPA
ncbi:alpha/beta hydrolase [Nocardioides bruguierae]|uniref:Alpha/beta hydrolase n=1 Tax=Nocardioides bruguierae TaxID=2945102 RepID=A0A9X2IE34_9ACTN|nr:alpha/beta hydrolase [Nocardioides bruguierae]MCM0618939.1 alpha/beta hydrolase [Nocardioides bruguierae]